MGFSGFGSVFNLASVWSGLTSLLASWSLSDDSLTISGAYLWSNAEEASEEMDMRRMSLDFWRARKCRGLED